MIEWHSEQKQGDFYDSIESGKIMRVRNQLKNIRASNESKESMENIQKQGEAVRDLTYAHRSLEDSMDKVYEFLKEREPIDPCVTGCWKVERALNDLIHYISLLKKSV